MLCLAGSLQRVLMPTLQFLETRNISRPRIAEDQSAFQEPKNYFKQRMF